jgi:adenylate cyclase
MQEAMDELNAKWNEQDIPELKMRIGIHHGPTVVGNFGSQKRSDYTAIGPTVNMASRIESACEPGHAYVSGEICDYLPEEMVQDAGTFNLKGVSGEITLYKLVNAP